MALSDIVSNEAAFMPYSKFVMEYTGNTLTRLKRIVKFPDDVLLLKNMAFHNLANLNRHDEQTHIFRPDIENIPYINNDHRVKCMVSFRDLFIGNLTNPSTVKLYARRKPLTATDQQLINQNQKTKTRIYSSVADVENLANNCVIYNHNPLWIHRPHKLPAYWSAVYVFANIINVVRSDKTHQHFIDIPVSKNTFTYQDFALQVAKPNIRTLTYKEDSYYVMLLEIINYLIKPENCKAIKHLTEDEEDRCYLSFTGIKGRLVVSLGDLKRVIGDKNGVHVLIRVLNQLVEEFNVEEATANIIQGTYKSIAEEKAKVDPKAPLEALPNAEQTFTKIQAKVTEAIEQNSVATPRQKEHVQKLASNIENITIHNKSLKEILNKPVPVFEKTTLDFLKDEVLDESMLTYIGSNFETYYMEHIFERELAQLAMSFVDKGLIPTNITTAPVHDKHNSLVTYTISGVQPDMKKFNIKFTVPLLDHDGRFVMNGNKFYFKKQLINNPIVKVSPTRVSLVSNLNKILVEKCQKNANTFIQYIKKWILKCNRQRTNTFEYTHQTTDYNMKISSEYCELATNYSHIQFKHETHGHLALCFDYENRMNGLPDAYKTRIEKIEESKQFADCIFLGVTGSTSKPEYLLFIDTDNLICKFNIDPRVKFQTTNMMELFMGVDMGDIRKDIKPLYEYTKTKIMDKELPVGFMLGYAFGLKEMLDYVGVNYIIYPEHSRIPKEINKIPLKFSDCTIVLDRYPLVKSMIFTGLSEFDLSEFSLEDYDRKETYTGLLVSSGASPNIRKGIDMFFSSFLDSQTIMALEEQHEPTNLKDLLIRATELLNEPYHIEPSSMANHRMRSCEKMLAIAYRQISRDLTRHQQINSDKPFSINPHEVLKQIMEDQLTVPLEQLNPMFDIKQQQMVSFVGTGGRSKDSFMIRDRIFPEDGIGCLSEATPDSSNTGINASLSTNPRLKSRCGQFDTKSDAPLEPAEMLSNTAVAVVGGTNDDGSRLNFINTQMNHYVPMAEGRPFRVTTGYDRVLAHQVSDDFASSAPMDGKVIDVNDELQCVTIKYSDKSTQVYHYGDKELTASGHVTVQTVANNFPKIGEKVKRGDIIIYNSEYFSPDPMSKQVDWKLGVPAKVALIDTSETYEDSSAISDTLATKLAFTPAHTRAIVIPANTMIHEIVSVGDHLTPVDRLMVFEEGEIADTFSLKESMADFIADLNKATPKSKHTGVVCKIEAVYNIPKNDIHPSLRKVIDRCEQPEIDLVKYAESKDDLETFTMPSPYESGDKLMGVDFSENGTVLLIFHIKESLIVDDGDKIVVGPSLKSVVTTVYPAGDLTTESGLPIDIEFSGRGQMARIVTSPNKIGVIETVMETVEQNMIAAYFNE